MRKLLYRDNPLLRTLASLPVVYYEYINLCSQYAIKDPLCSRKYIRESVWNTDTLFLKKQQTYRPIQLTIQ